MALLANCYDIYGAERSPTPPNSDGQTDDSGRHGYTDRDHSWSHSETCAFSELSTKAIKATTSARRQQFGDSSTAQPLANALPVWIRRKLDQRQLNSRTPHALKLQTSLSDNGTQDRVGYRHKFQEYIPANACHHEVTPTVSNHQKRLWINPNPPLQGEEPVPDLAVDESNFKRYVKYFERSLNNRPQHTPRISKTRSTSSADRGDDRYWRGYRTPQETSDRSTQSTKRHRRSPASTWKDSQSWRSDAPPADGRSCDPTTRLSNSTFPDIHSYDHPSSRQYFIPGYSEYTKDFEVPGSATRKSRVMSFKAPSYSCNSDNTSLLSTRKTSMIDSITLEDDSGCAASLVNAHGDRNGYEPQTINDIPERTLLVSELPLSSPTQRLLQRPEILRKLVRSAENSQCEPYHNPDEARLSNSTLNGLQSNIEDSVADAEVCEALQKADRLSNAVNMRLVVTRRFEKQKDGHGKLADRRGVTSDEKLLPSGRPSTARSDIAVARWNSTATEKSSSVSNSQRSDNMTAPGPRKLSVRKNLSVKSTDAGSRTPRSETAARFQRLQTNGEPSTKLGERSNGIPQNGKPKPQSKSQMTTSLQPLYSSRSASTDRAKSTLQRRLAYNPSQSRLRSSKPDRRKEDDQVVSKATPRAKTDIANIFRSNSMLQNGNASSPRTSYSTSFQATSGARSKRIRADSADPQVRSNGSYSEAHSKRSQPPIVPRRQNKPLARQNVIFPNEKLPYPDLAVESINLKLDHLAGYVVQLRKRMEEDFAEKGTCSPGDDIFADEAVGAIVNGHSTGMHPVVATSLKNLRLLEANFQEIYNFLYPNEIDIWTANIFTEGQ